MKLNFEQRSGMSFDDVRVHYNSDKPARFHALAYTQGTQIYVGPGQERSLPHELGHVIQQKAGRVRPTRWVRGQPVNDQPELEREADCTPVQCIPAPALWGVIQMMPILPSQRGANCGYHALARAMYELNNGPLGYPLDENSLEKQLTTHAIQTGRSIIGEAFDPYALAYVGSEYCDMHAIPMNCTVVTLQDEEGLEGILADSNSIILVPYFPDMTPIQPENDMEPIQNLLHKPNAHWGVIDPRSRRLYEGNSRGSVYVENGEQKHMEPLEVGLDKLLESNNSIEPSFNWIDFFIDSVVNGLKSKTADAAEKADADLNQKEAFLQAFAEGEGINSFCSQVETIMSDITYKSLPENQKPGFIALQELELKKLVEHLTENPYYRASIKDILKQPPNSQFSWINFFSKNGLDQLIGIMNNNRKTVYVEAKKENINEQKILDMFWSKEGRNKEKIFYQQLQNFMRTIVPNMLSKKQDSKSWDDLDSLLKSQQKNDPYFKRTIGSQDGLVDAVIRIGLEKMNNYRRAVSVMSTDKEPVPILQDFKGVYDFLQQVQHATGKTDPMSEDMSAKLEDELSTETSPYEDKQTALSPSEKDASFIQNVSLQGHAVKVSKKQ